MSQTAIGKAALILTTDSAQAKAGLSQFSDFARSTSQRVEGEFAHGFSKTQKTANKAFAKFAKKEGGFLGAIGGGVIGDFGLGSTAAILTGIILGAKQLVHVIDGVTGHTRDWVKELERGQDQIDKVAKSLEKARAVEAEWLAAVVEPRDRLAALDAQIRTEEMRLAVARNSVAETQKKIHDLDSWGSGQSWRLWLKQVQGISLESAKGELTKFKSEAEKTSDVLDQLRQQKLRLMEPSADPNLTGDVNRLISSLKLANATFGRTGFEAKIYELKLRGADAGALKLAQDLADVNKALTEQKQALRIDPSRLLNKPLLKGTSAEVSARLQHDFAGRLVMDRMLEEQKRGNKALENIDRGVRRIADRKAPNLPEL